MDGIKGELHFERSTCLFETGAIAARDKLIPQIKASGLTWNQLKAFWAGYQKTILEFEKSKTDPASALMEVALDTLGKAGIRYLGTAISAGYLSEAIRWHSQGMDEQASYALQASTGAMRCDDYEGIKLAAAGQTPSWYTPPLIDMCNIARQHKPKRTAKDIYHALPDTTPVAPIKSIRMNDFGSLTIESTGRWVDANYEFSTFESRFSEWTTAGLIKRKKLL